MKILRRFAFSVAVLLAINILIALTVERELFISRAEWIFGDNQEEENSIKKALLVYNKIFTDLYASNGQTLRLNDFPAAKRLRHEVYRDLDFLRAHQLLLVYDMADLTFIEIKRSMPLTAEVITYEEWNFIYQELSSRRPSQSIKGMEQGFKYIMQKQKGQWVVVDYIPVKVKPPEKKDEFYF